MNLQADYRERFAQHDLADFAQEFLGRNPEYRKQAAAVSERRVDDSAMEVARSWGLEFRLSRSCGCDAAPRDLVH